MEVIKHYSWTYSPHCPPCPLCEKTPFAVYAVLVTATKNNSTIVYNTQDNSGNIAPVFAEKSRIQVGLKCSGRVISKNEYTKGCQILIRKLAKCKLSALTPP